jgi:ATP-dependent Clp protease ATP-binding subunit ClpC
MMCMCLSGSRSRARRVVVLAQTEARELRFSQIGTESVLLGLLRKDAGVAARVLESFDITVERVRAGGA